MKHLTLILTLSILTFSCSEAPPKWTQKGFDEFNIEYTALELINAKINGIPFYSDLTTFTNEFGHPIDSTRLYGFTWNQLKNHSDSIPYTQINLKNISLISALGQTKIIFADFFRTEYELETKEFGILTNETKLSTIKNKAIKSYEMRNQPIELSVCEYSPITEEDINNGLVTWLKFSGSKNGSCDDLQMIFYRKKLAFIKVTGIDLQTECF